MRKTDFTADEHALLAAVHAHPRDDLPRLVYADWLEGNNEHDLAEMIRIGVQYARDSKRLDLHARIKELDLPLRKKYVRPAPARTTFMQWYRGLPLLKASFSPQRCRVRRFIDEARPRITPLLTFTFSLNFFQWADGSMEELLHDPFMKQVQFLWLDPFGFTTVADIEMLAASPYWQHVGQFTLSAVVAPEVSDAVMKLLAPRTTVLWSEQLEGGPLHSRLIVSDTPRTWPERHAPK